MIGVVIVAHGGLAREYLLAVEHVVGKQSDMQAISIEDDCDRDKKQAEICAAANAVDHGEGVVVVTDMFGGSPSNLSLMAGCAGSAADHLRCQPAHVDQTGQIPCLARE